MKIALVLLSFNEIDGVSALLPSLCKTESLSVDEIFAVDGGSTDGTLEQYNKYGVPVHQQNSRGRGEAMRLATQFTDADYLVFFSPDGNEDLQDIPKFRPFFEAGNDLVIASRMCKGAYNEEDASFFKARKWVNNLFNLAANLIFRKTGSYITDSINGFRGLRKNLLSEIHSDAQGYTVEYQMTIRAMRAGMKVAEFPSHEGARIGGETKAPSFPTGVKFIKCLFEEILGLIKTRSSSVPRQG